MFDRYADIFRRRADRYQQAMTACPDARDAEFRAVADPLGSAATILDMPSGGGYLARHLPAAARYIAVEPTEYFLENCPAAPATRILAPIHAVPLPAASADAIVSLAGLHHEADLTAVFAEMRRLIRIDGIVVIADVACDTPPARFLNEYVHRNSAMGHDGRFLDAGTTRALTKAGFAILADELVPTPWRFAGRRAAGAFCTDLFGIDGPDADQVAAALASIVGLTGPGDRPEVAWSLRRIVCRPHRQGPAAPLRG